MSRIKDSKGNKLFKFGKGISGITKDNKRIPKEKAKKLYKEHKKEQRKRLDFGKPLDFGKEIKLGKDVDLGKSVDLGIGVDFGKELDLE